MQLKFILLLLILIFVNCSKNDFDCNCISSFGKTCLVYEQTYCADPWGNSSLEDEKIAENLNSYFQNLGVEINDICFDEEGTIENCYACSCKSGRRIKVKVKNKNWEILRNLGFTEL